MSAENEKIKALEENIGSVVKGKPEVIRMAVISLLAKGHLLIEDVPGVGKTTLAHALARSLGCIFQRIQFTSDLLPSDIIGVSIYNQATHEFEFKPGPIFSNIILADEINRTTPKTQSCLLEAMNDFQVSVENRTHPLPSPFMVLATQNPLEYHGTFPLPESQLDRFMMRIRIGYPSAANEMEILTYQGTKKVENLLPVVSSAEVLELQALSEKVRMEGSLVDYILRIVNSTRSSDLLTLGVSTRGAIHLYRAAQAKALAEGREFCIPDDIKEMASPVLAHRVILSSRMESEREDAEGVISDILERTPVPV
ncbi:MAG: MoxR family ATPase [Deltaproteobacteria bacterium]|nr:MoxR family ATPase [Deltaproteobacteria bacterium]